MNLLIDDHHPNCKWFCFKQAAGKVLFKFDGPKQVSAYSIQTANDGKDRFPSHWKVQMKMDQGEFYEVDEQKHVPHSPFSE